MPKLVRDRVPELMKEAGERPSVRVLHDDKEYLQALNAKLLEEVKEYGVDHDIEELADVMDVVETLYEFVNERSGGELARVRSEKRATKGGFVARQLLLTHPARPLDK